MATLTKASSKKEKVTVSIDANLLQMIDTFVEASEDEISRSAVFEHALHLWKQAVRDAYDLQYYSENEEQLQQDNDSWSAISTEAAKHIWSD